MRGQLLSEALRNRGTAFQRRRWRFYLDWADCDTTCVEIGMNSFREAKTSCISEREWDLLGFSFLFLLGRINVKTGTEHFEKDSGVVGNSFNTLCKVPFWLKFSNTLIGDQVSSAIGPPTRHFPFFLCYNQGFVFVVLAVIPPKM